MPSFGLIASNCKETFWNIYQYLIACICNTGTEKYVLKFTFTEIPRLITIFSKSHVTSILHHEFSFTSNPSNFTGNHAKMDKFLRKVMKLVKSHLRLIHVSCAHDPSQNEIINKISFKVLCRGCVTFMMNSSGQYLTFDFLALVSILINSHERENGILCPKIFPL